MFWRDKCAFCGLCSRHEHCFKSPLNCVLTIT